MISRSARQRIGALLREEARAKPGARRPGAGPGPQRANGAAPAKPRARKRAKAAAASPTREIVPTGIEEILPGGELTCREGAIFVHERLYTELREKPGPLLRKYEGIVEGRRTLRRRARDLPEAVEEVVGSEDDPAALERLIFRTFGHRRMLLLDIETCGLSSAPVFLVGLCHVGERNLVLRQLFARNYSEERALLAHVAAIARGYDFLVTFNGRTFDMPFLRDRAIHHRLRFEIGLPHLDLLLLARRRWRSLVPDCRLTTLEWHVLRRRRGGDIDGAAIPGIYHDYVKRGQPDRLLPVFHHNLLDLVAMAELLPHALDLEAGPRRNGWS